MLQPKEIFVKTDRCLGCLSCTIACAVEHSKSKTLFGAIWETPVPKSRVYVEWVEPEGKVPLVCRHCEEAPCMYACISGAISRDENGVVITDKDKCIGCWTCVMVCPYGVIGRHLEEHKAFRCDRCPDREIPACVSACPTGALVYDTVDSFSGRVRKNASGSCCGQKGDNVTEDKSKYIIVGGSAAGMAAAHTIRLHDRQGPVTVLSEEPDMPYFRPLIPFLVSGKKRAVDMVLAGCGPYTGRDIFVRTGVRVESVNTVEKTVSVQGNGGLAYEKILFATGSRPYIPPEIKGVDADGVFALKTLADARNMAKRVETSDHAVMLGGGILNLKVAFALLERGLEVTLVVYSPEVLSQLMEPEDAFLIRKALDRAGLKIKTGCSSSHIIADSTGVTGVAIDHGGEMSCQMVCIGKGVRPNIEFLDGSDVRIDGGIVADRYTGCNVPDTFAAGDVAVTFEPVSGDRIMTALWTNAVEMGRCAGLNMAGVKTAYSGTFGILNATQVADEPFVSMGVVHTKDDDFELYRHVTETTYRKVVFNKEGTRLIGAIFIGDITNAGLYRYVIREKMPVMNFKRYIIDHTLHYGHFVT